MTEPVVRRPWWRRFRLSLRALIVLILASGVLMGLYVHRYRTQRGAIEAIQRLGGYVDSRWSWEAPPPPGLFRAPGLSELPGPLRWVIDRIGVELFSEVVEVHIRQGDDSTLAGVRYFPHTEILRLQGYNGVSDAGLAPLAGLTRLRLLDLSGTRVQGPGLGYIAGLRGIEMLDLSLLPISSRDLENIARIASLRELKISRDYLSDEGLSALSGLDHLETLSINESTIDGSGLVHLARLRKLKKLDLSRSAISRVDGLRGSKLIELNLGKTRIGKGSLASLAEVPSLIVLLLRDTAVGDDDLAPLAGHRSLGALDLTSTKVTDAGLRFVATIPNLIFLQLDQDAITDLGLASLKPMARCQTVTVLNTKVTAPGVATLRSSLPNLRVDSIFTPPLDPFATAGSMISPLMPSPIASPPTLIPPAP